MNPYTAPTSADYIRHLPMEIPPAFYPLPTVRVPDEAVPVLRKYEYKFDRERAAILRYQQEQTRLRLLEEEEADRKRIIAEEEEEARRMAEEEEARRAEVEAVQRLKLEAEAKAVEMETMRRVEEQLQAKLNVQKRVPMPSTASPPTSFTPGCSLQKADEAVSSSSQQPAGTNSRSTQNNKNMNKGVWEEFETKRDPFELVELHSLDDRRELEKLLLAFHGDSVEQQQKRKNAGGTIDG